MGFETGRREDEVTVTLVLELDTIWDLRLTKSLRMSLNEVPRSWRNKIVRSERKKERNRI